MRQSCTFYRSSNDFSRHEVPVLTLMDEAQLQKFGGSNLIQIMQNLGLKKDESFPIQSIRHAQDRLAPR